MQKIHINWHFISSEEYIRQVKATEDVKKFDFIHMIQVLFAVYLKICHLLVVN